MICLRHAGTVLLVALALLLAPGAGTARSQTRNGSPNMSDLSNCDRANFRTVVDVGHTAEAPGAISARGVHEYEFNLTLAKLIEQDLIAAGFDKTLLLVTDGH